MIIYEYGAVVVGSGAAGWNAACRIASFGKKTVALVTENVLAGTSRNAGSDKQTYYKLSLSGSHPDSICAMAEDLFAGGAVDGDNALCEAALSVPCFLNLVSAGVEFPTDRYGCYTGYKTDHDPGERATSAGPLTSKFMTEALEKRAREMKIPVFDHLTAVEVLTVPTKTGRKTVGLLCVDEKGGLTAFRTENVVLCTGGPAGLYADSVYPASQTGSTGLALRAGAETQNLTEWQYGLATVSPRWNVSGTYMQVLPCFVSVGEDGDEREFLLDDFGGDPYAALSAVFLKGYQWPFDSAKAENGSSVIDLLVYREEKMKGRRVYLDYRKNPFGLKEIDFSRLSDEARVYLEKCAACFGTPIERLEKMNAPAIALYRSKGVDLASERVKIALCAQHHNGGISVDHHWQTRVTGLYAAGECAGTHGVRRPGGSALNAGQVGSLRAAEHLSFIEKAPVTDAEFETALADAEKTHLAFLSSLTDGEENALSLIRRVRDGMSKVGAAIREPDAIAAFLSELKKEEENLSSLRTPDAFAAYRAKDLIVTALAVLTAMLDYAETVGASRGSAITVSKNGVLRPGLPEAFRFLPPTGTAADRIQTVSLDGEGQPKAAWRPVRPIPDTSDSFEVVWQGYRENRNLK
ncbi:MAG: FAD-binding protein [Lachnospiraceae bacterium]|nr:FAD-binding protein [Lachnospiraceae bacterium]